MRNAQSKIKKVCPAASMSIERGGEFSFFVVPGSAHCTPANTNGDNHRTVRYFARVISDNDCRDKKNFALDNAAIQPVFNRFVKVSVSCEELCVRAARELFKKSMHGDRRNADKIQRIEVKIWGTPQAAATFVYDRSMMTMLPKAFAAKA